MGNFFRSSPKKEEPKPAPQAKPKGKSEDLSSADKARLELKRGRDRLRRQQEAAELCIAQEKAVAKELVAKGQKDKAILVLKRKAMKEKLLERARGQMLNVETMIANIEEAETNLKVFETLKLGNETLKTLQEQMSVDDINDILDDTAESIRVQEDISAALSQSLNTSEQAEIDAEVAEMMELMDQGFDPFETNTTDKTTKTQPEKVKTKPVKEEVEPDYGDILPDAPKHTPVVQKKEEQEEEEEEEQEEEAVLA
jgi:charged multivesicular body protein 6